jgi:Lrp/AsnC family leucine-responsive transcriptional regulator
LRESGVILKEVALLDARMAGNQLNLVVSVEMERDRADIYKRFSAAVQAAPEVMECYQVSGETDFVLIVSVADVQAYEHFIDRVLHKDPNIRKFHTAISIRRVKYTTAFDLSR